MNTMMKKLINAFVLILITSTGYSQITPYDKPVYSTYKSLTQEEILAPAIIQRQRHDSMAKSINDVIRYVNDLKSQTNDPQFIANMDGYLNKIRNLGKALEERGINAVSMNNLSEIYNNIQDEISRYNNRIEQQKKIQNQLTNYIEVANDAMNNHRYSVAIENLTKAINLVPNNPDNKKHYMTRGFCYLFGVNKPHEAAQDFTKYCQLCESNSTDQAEAFYLIGSVYEMKGDLALAAVNYSNCIKIDNSHLDAYYRRGIMKSGLNNRAAAILDYDYIINYTGAAKLAFKDMATVYNNKAYCLIELGNYDDALPLVNKALELDNSLAYIWDTRGELYYHKGLYQKCIEDMNKAIFISSESANSYYYRGLANMELNRKNEACNDLSKASELGHEKASNSKIKYCN